MTEPDTLLKRNLKNKTISDCKLQDKQYQKLDLLFNEIDDHVLNGRTSESDKILNEILKLNREITDTENRCRSRLGLKKL